ncbi:acyl-CoA dehydrogenase domain-containing protein [Thecamonas trahens ATCC 50062]|uniref:Isobutyryl-CoA dehydrogenase, mitochondrial n=1 Tax=Thecamonas trahens ATCC 50062 TaxID=461836 RepID=A0A0L0DIF2_THETB|nr:acyl-CoA dehydrogenase domain-containing protein [Thecamonas trahens ATCC 50062]KNC51093.1 acyl-CoA dehydrogenase domain-containing protein [Thecamonas trahens ATCC 50062]|eukprot:XP_013756546.1 acyl-CoA dehydrogenase domain-containing protein [Thecamonas trahens ATCC 50062]
MFRAASAAVRATTTATMAVAPAVTARVSSASKTSATTTTTAKATAAASATSAMGGNRLVAGGSLLGSGNYANGGNVPFAVHMRSSANGNASFGGMTGQKRFATGWATTALSPTSPFSATVGLDDEQLMFYETAAAFAAENIAPHASKWDAESIFPKDVVHELGNLGFGAMYTSEEHGGSGASRLDAALVFEALSMGCPATSAYLSIHNMCTWMVDSFGSDELRAEFVPRMATMEALGSYCLTEPGSGSDAAALRTTAVVSSTDEDVYVLNGEKAFISGAGETDVYLIMARTGSESGAKGVSCFLVDAESDGLSFGGKLDKMGWNASPTRPVIMQDVKVHKSRMLGAPGEGFKIAMKGLDGGRINIGACSIGAAAASVGIAREYVLERTAFGKPLARFQNTEFVFADMAAKLRTSRLAIRDAAKLLHERSPLATSSAALAKLTATEQCFDVINSALQTLGGAGYVADYQIERYLRDARVHSILEGSSEIMRLVTARAIFADQ